MGSVTLKIGERLVLVAEGGLPPVEFALFDPGEVELGNVADGDVREVGFRTTASLARKRLAALGVTAALADEAAIALGPAGALAYARGSVVRRIAARLGPAELFEGRLYDAALRLYLGGLLDLALLIKDVRLSHGTAKLHALGLAAQLDEVPPDTVVAFDTRGHLEPARLGERAYRKAVLEGVQELPRALTTLVESGYAGEAAERTLPAQGPTKAEVTAVLRERAGAVAHVAARERLLALERAMVPREAPVLGPLADPELWSIELQLSNGDTSYAESRIDGIERARGRTPGTIYLRARAHLLDGREPSRDIAARIAPLVLGLPDFLELELLAAQAWGAAGEMRKAAPYVRDLLANPRAHADLKSAASQVLEPSSHGPRDDDDVDWLVRANDAAAVLATQPSSPLTGPAARRHAAAMASTLPPPGPLSWNAVPPPAAPPSASTVPLRARTADYTPTLTPPPLTLESVPPLAAPPADAPAKPARSVPAPAALTRLSLTPPVMDSRASAGSSPAPRDAPSAGRLPLAPASARRAPLVPRTDDDAPAPTFETAIPISPRARPRPPTESPRSPRSPQPAPPRVLPADPAPSIGGRPSAAPRIVTSKPPSAVPSSWPSRLPAPREEPYLPDDVEQSLRGLSGQAAVAGGGLRGASLPVSRTEPPDDAALAPALPQLEPADPVPLESLPLSREADGVPFDSTVLPRSPLEARIRCTLLTRKLGARYLEAGLRLRLEVAMLRPLQEYLLSRFPTGTIRTRDEAYEAELHGAALSELLARTLGGEWLDVAPTEPGYWAMVIPTGVPGAARGRRRVWPFGRVLRLIAGVDDDLVGYYERLREGFDPR